MNVLLHKHGFIEGGPGAWRPTQLGVQFAAWVDKDNGYGGYAHRAWSWLSWNEDVVDALKASIKANPNGVMAASPGPVAGTGAAVGAKAAANGSRAGNGKWVALAVLGAAAVAAPAIRHLRG